MNNTVQSDPPVRPPRPLPVTIAAGQPVVEISDAMPATVVGFTQAYCIYRLDHSKTLSVAPWHNVALGNVCPAEPLLPADVTENDRRNMQACVLRELLELQAFGLSETQAAALEELVGALCGGPGPGTHDSV